MPGGTRSPTRLLEPELALEVLDLALSLAQGREAELGLLDPLLPLRRRRPGRVAGLGHPRHGRGEHLDLR